MDLPEQNNKSRNHANCRSLKNVFACCLVMFLVSDVSSLSADCGSDVSKIFQAVGVIKNGMDLLAQVKRIEESKDVERDLGAVSNLERELRKFDKLKPTTDEKADTEQSDDESEDSATQSVKAPNQSKSAESESIQSTNGATSINANSHAPGSAIASPHGASTLIPDADVSTTGSGANAELARELRQFDKRLLHLDAETRAARLGAGELEATEASLDSSEGTQTLPAGPIDDLEDSNESIPPNLEQTGPNETPPQTTPHDMYVFDESVEDDVARTLREAIQMEKDPQIKAELKRSYDDYIEIIKK